MNWNSFPLEVFERKAVHYASHPLHSAFQSELGRVRSILMPAGQVGVGPSAGRAHATVVHVNL